jgi:Tfp pilus assembly pilus retraction ATPase PilT
MPKDIDLANLRMDHLVDYILLECFAQIAANGIGYVTDIHFQENRTPFMNQCGEWIPTTEEDSPFLHELLNEDMLDGIREYSLKKAPEYLKRAITAQDKRGDGLKDSRDYQAYAFDWYPLEAAKTVGPPFDIEEMKSLTTDETLINYPWRIRVEMGTSVTGKFVSYRLLRGFPLSLPEIGMPARLEELLLPRKGIVLICGPTGGGKTTTLAGLARSYSENSIGHIVSIEDPVEYRYDFRQIPVTQMELGLDIPSYSEGIRKALRLKAKMIVVGEIRGPEELRAIIQAAKSGHLVLATTHETKASEVLEYIEDMTSPGERDYVRKAMVRYLNGIICQSLIPCQIDSYDVVRPNMEFLSFPYQNERLRTLMLRGEYREIDEWLDSQEATDHGCWSWNKGLMGMKDKGIISDQTYEYYVRDSAPL